MIKLFEKLNRGKGVKGRITIREYPAGAIAKFKELIAAGKIDEFKDLQKQGKVAMATDNLIMGNSNTGTDMIVQWLGAQYLMAQGGSVSPTGINWGAIGTSNTAPAITDTQLGAETNRQQISFFQDFQFNQAQLQFFFADGILANGTYNEFGTFVNGTSSPNTGQIFNHALFSSPYVKTSGVDTTVEVDITV